MLPRLEYIKQARGRLGITQRRLASLTGISTSMINQIETGRCKPSYDTAKKIFEVLSTLEDNLAKKMVENDEKNIKNMTIDNVMEPSPPLVDSVTPAKALVPLIRFAKCILVTEKGNVTGIITTTDILKMVE